MSADAEAAEADAAGDSDARQRGLAMVRTVQLHLDLRAEMRHGPAAEGMVDALAMIAARVLSDGFARQPSEPEFRAAVLGLGARVRDAVRVGMAAREGRKSP